MGSQIVFLIWMCLLAAEHVDMKNEQNLDYDNNDKLDGLSVEMCGIRMIEKPLTQVTKRSNFPNQKNVAMKYDKKKKKRPTVVRKINAGQKVHQKNDLPARRPHYMRAIDKIMGGNLAVHGYWPWLARIAYKVGNTSEHLCGAAIVSRFWVVTAAHCLRDITVRKTKYLEVSVGDYDTSILADSVQRFSVDHFLSHPSYNRKTYENDIAMIKVYQIKSGKGIEYNDYVQPICLPNKDTSYNRNVKCWVAGWGIDHPESEVAPAILKEARMPLLDIKECWKMIRRVFHSLNVTADFDKSSMICAGYWEGDADACQGDSGGPLMCQHKGVFTLFGVVSFGYKCGGKGTPGVYTKVSAFRNWIEAVSTENGN